MTAILLASTPAVAQQNNVEWRRVEADNGAAYAIDMKSIRVQDPMHGTTFAIVCVVENNTCPLQNMSRLMFDCRGRYWNVDRPGSIQLAAPRSVAGRLAEIACSRTRPAQPRSDRPTEGPAAQSYQARYLLAGFLLRAAIVCGDDPKGTVQSAMSLLDTPELKKVSQAYPATIQKWMEEGAEKLNMGVMTDGVTVACAFVSTVRREADDMAKATC